MDELQKRFLVASVTLRRSIASSVLETISRKGWATNSVLWQLRASHNNKNSWEHLKPSLQAELPYLQVCYSLELQRCLHFSCRLFCSSEPLRKRKAVPWIMSARTSYSMIAFETLLLITNDRKRVSITGATIRILLRKIYMRSSQSGRFSLYTNGRPRSLWKPVRLRQLGAFGSPFSYPSEIGTTLPQTFSAKHWNPFLLLVTSRPERPHPKLTLKIILWNFKGMELCFKSGWVKAQNKINQYITLCVGGTHSGIAKIINEEKGKKTMREMKWFLQW